jgi:hypothetical protein
MGVYSRYKVQPAYSKPPVLEEQPEPAAAGVATAEEIPKPPRRRQPRLIKPEKAEPQEQPAIHDEKLFSREVLVVEQEANTRDSAYWAEIRPVPLTQEEKLDYQRKDSLEEIRESKVYKDSVDRIRNKPTFGNLFMRGYTYSNTYERRTYTLDPLLSFTGGRSILQYNTVEGAVANVGVRFRQNFEDRRRYEIEPVIRYGFSNERLNAKLRLSYTFDPIRRSTITVDGGRFVDQINSNEPISPFANTVYTLLLHKNYMKLYQREYARVHYRTELLNGVNLQASLDYAHRMPLQNTTDYTFRESGGTGFTSNVPENAELADASFEAHQAMTAAFTVTFRPGMDYISRPDQKINLGSSWPSFSLGYRGGIKALGGDVQYATLALRIADEFSLGLVGSSNFSVTGGTFWGKEDMRLMDFRHFSGNRTIFAGEYTGFQLLDYYRYSTRHRYLEGHFEHHFNGFLFNKVPLFRRLKWQEVVSLHYLNTRESNNYLELGLGVEHIFKVLRVDFVTSFQEQQKVRTGLRIGLGF